MDPPVGLLVAREVDALDERATPLPAPSISRS
jgi:hypothetical protein